VLAECRAHLGAAGGRRDAHIVLAEVFGDELPHRRFIVDDQNVGL
jgi:hypothetical protein